MVGAIDVDLFHGALVGKGDRRSLALPFGPDPLLEIARRLSGVRVDGRRLSTGPGPEAYELETIDRHLLDALGLEGAARRADVGRTLGRSGCPPGPFSGASTSTPSSSGHRTATPWPRV